MLIPDYIYKKIFSFIPDLIQTQESVLLYPSGSLTKELLKKDVLQKCNIAGIADKNITNEYFDEELQLNIYKKESIKSINPKNIVICSISFHNEIMLDLLSFCINNNIKLIDLCEDKDKYENHTQIISPNLNDIHTLLCSSEIRAILSTPKYLNEPRYLEPFGYKCYSQHDEDGMFAEIVRRIGTSFPKKFVEFGVGDGMENNSLLLLKQGWQGLWIEGSKTNARSIENKFENIISRNQLFFENQFITKDNINSLIGKYFKEDIGLLCIDIDGNDYYIWDEINIVNPWVVIIEYNGKFPPSMKWSIEYDSEHIWNGSDYQGASLFALFELGRKKGYQLVGCNINGTNAFFVRNDKLGENFVISDNVSDYYHPARYYLTNGYNKMAGHTPDSRMGKIL